MKPFQACNHDKGLKNGSCNRTCCQEPGAIWYNHGTHKYYCTACAHLLNDVNDDWAPEQFGHNLCTKETDVNI